MGWGGCRIIRISGTTRRRQKGEHGYGWLPYEYAERGLAEDFWSVLKKEWMDTGALGRKKFKLF